MTDKNAENSEDDFLFKTTAKQHWIYFLTGMATVFAIATIATLILQP